MDLLQPTGNLQPEAICTKFVRILICGGSSQVADLTAKYSRQFAYSKYIQVCLTTDDH